MAFVSFGTNADNTERMQDPDQGGGAILDLGIYCLNIVDMMFGGEEPPKHNSSWTENSCWCRLNYCSDDAL